MHSTDYQFLIAIVQYILRRLAIFFLTFEVLGTAGIDTESYKMTHIVVMEHQDLLTASGQRVHLLKKFSLY